MTYVWTQDLATGNSVIDQEHKQLIEAINQLLEACAQGKGRRALEGTCAFLEEYTAKHFAHEEQLQQRHNYPDYVNHKRYHEQFKREVAQICAQLKAQGPTIVLVGRVNSSIGGWLVNHIKQQDAKVAAHIRG